MQIRTLMAQIGHPRLDTKTQSNATTRCLIKPGKTFDAVNNGSVQYVPPIV